jgi:hypothetical protein
MDIFQRSVLEILKRPFRPLFYCKFEKEEKKKKLTVGQKKANQEYLDNRIAYRTQLFSNI